MYNTSTTLISELPGLLACSALDKMIRWYMHSSCNVGV